MTPLAMLGVAILAVIAVGASTLIVIIVRGAAGISEDWDFY